MMNEVGALYMICRQWEIWQYPSGKIKRKKNQYLFLKKLVTEEWTMRCRVCGSNNEDGSKFCWNCGNKLTEQSENEKQ